MVANNVKSPEVYIEHGASAAVAEVVTDGCLIRAERGRALSKYTVVSGEGPEGESVFAKSGTSVPDQVSALLRFAQVEGEDLNFALQFDRPFLLDVPASSVAKVIGDLTNINRIYAAVREANRRRLETSARLKVRQTDVARLREQAAGFSALPAQQKACRTAREALDRASQAAVDASTIEAQIGIVEAAEAALEAMQELPPLPEFDLASLDQRVGEIIELARLVRVVGEATTEEETASSDLDSIDQQITNLDQTYHETLKESGTCPLCGATIK